MIELVNRSEIKFLGVCMLLLSAAAGWLLLTRPTHRIEGDFLQREDRRTVDDWLVEQLVSPIAEYRVRACRALGRIGDESTLGLLLKVLEDPIPRVRAEAAFAIGEMDDRDTRAELGRAPRAAAVAGLMSALADDERIVVTNVVEALGKLRRAEAYPRLTQTAAPLPVTMAALVRLEKREAVPWIAARRRSDDQETRWAATQALLDLQADVGEELTRSFINLMRDRNPWIRLEAARGLGRVEPSKEVRQALVAAIDDPDPKVVMQGLRSISDVKPPDALPLLVESLGHRNENVRAAAVEALGNLGDPKAVPLIESLRGRASPVSYQAEIALAKLGAPSVFSEAGGELPEKYRHAAAIESLLSGAGPRSPPALLEWAARVWEADEDFAHTVRPAILRTLAAAKHPDTERYLREAVGDADPRVRRVALELLPSASVETCRSGYENAADDPATRLAALDCAARSTSGQGGASSAARALFEKALDDPIRRVRIRAVKQLRLLFNEDHDEKIGSADVRYDEAEYQHIARSTSRLIRIETSVGEIELKLDYANAPLTARNFVELAREGFYTGQRFVDVVPGSYALAGDPRETDRPESDYKMPGYTIRTEINREPFLRGSLAMAEGHKDSAATRFIICLAPQPLWEGRYTNFGRLVSGDALLDRITVETRILRVVVP